MTDLRSDGTRRILWLKSAIPWPLTQGTNFIAWNLFSTLAPDYEIDYLALATGADSAALATVAQVATVRTLPRANLWSDLHRAAYAGLYRLRSAISYRPPEIFYELPRHYRREVRRSMETDRYDLLFMHYWYLAELGDWLGDHNVAVLLHDDETGRLESEAESVTDSKLRYDLLCRAEYCHDAHLRMMERVRHVFFYTPEDRAAFFERAGREYENAHVFPYFYRTSEVPRVEVEGDTVAFTGKMSYRPNVVAAVRLATRIWPLVRRERPDARLLLMGTAPTPEVRELDGFDGVTVTGFVPDLRTELAKAAVYVAPVTIGGGLKIKLMEAAELSKAIVATEFALTGFDFQPGEDHLRGETDEEIAAAVVRLLGDPAERERLGKGARAALDRKFAGPAVAKRIRDLFEKLTRGESPE